MDEIVTYLFNLALKNKIGVEATNLLSPEAPSIAVADERKIIINLNWPNKNELPFQIAHEISHILNHDDGVLYYTTYASQSKIEANANLTAIGLLATYYQDCFDFENINPVRFMQTFGIPLNLEYQVTDKLTEIFGI